MIAMCRSDHPREVVRNLTSLSAPTWTFDSTVVQPTSYLKGQRSQRFSNSLPFGGTLKAQPS